MSDEENVNDGSDLAPEGVASTVNIDKDGNQRSPFPMYHYNSMRYGTLTNFTVDRLVDEEVIGLPVGLSSSNNHRGHQSGSGDDLEAVLRTKFPGCNIVWGPGKAPPSLH